MQASGFVPAPHAPDEVPDVDPPLYEPHQDLSHRALPPSAYRPAHTRAVGGPVCWHAALRRPPHLAMARCSRWRAGRFYMTL